MKSSIIKPQILVAKNITLANDILRVISNAFARFKNVYTKEAFEATILTEEIIKTRIESTEITVFFATFNHEIVATVSTKVQYGDELFFFSMAVSPEYTRKGIGGLLMMSIEKEATLKNCKFIVLETFAPLLEAIGLYEGAGFIRTGKVREYNGIQIFQMKKEILIE